MAYILLRSSSFVVYRSDKADTLGQGNLCDLSDWPVQWNMLDRDTLGLRVLSPTPGAQKHRIHFH